jgi:hypothetical protein
MKSPLLFTPKQTLKKVEISQNFSIENLIKIRLVFIAFLHGNREKLIWRIETGHIIKLVLQTRRKLQRCSIGSTIPHLPTKAFFNSFGSQTV